jgi:hypothetical protein
MHKRASHRRPGGHELSVLTLAYIRLESYLAVTQQLIPLFPTEFAHAIVLGSERIVPHEAVGRVLNTGTHHMICVDIAESLQGLTES